MRLRGPAHTFAFFPNSFWPNLVIACGAVFAAYQTAQIVLAGDITKLEYVAVLLMGIAVSLAILKDWRRGLYIFLGWILFEDLVRKYLGNNMVIYFAKDALVVTVYLAFFRGKKATTRGRFKPPFWVPFLIFLWWCVLEAFNPESNSIVFGLLGLKISFLYVPLIVLGYYLVESEEDIRRLLLFNAILILIVSGLGLVQSILGPSFLNPAVQDDYIALLANTYRYSNEGEVAYRPTSVFVSTGRFQDFLLVSWPISLGFATYLSFLRKQGRIVALCACGAVGVASVMSVSRSVLLWNSVSVVMIVLAFLWGAPKRKQQVRRSTTAVLTLTLCGLLCLGLMAWYFPTDLKARVDVFYETLLPSSPTSEFATRSGSYPWTNFMKAFNNDHWLFGYGTGTSSLGVQYVQRIFNIRRMEVAVESGYGQLILEVGIIGLLLWIALSFSICWYAWKAVKTLKRTSWFPLGFAIFWFAFLLLIPMTYYSFQIYQDFVINAYFWFLLGILFRLKNFVNVKRDEELKTSRDAAIALAQVG